MSTAKAKASNKHSTILWKTK